MVLEERVRAVGHENVRGEHESTFEFTTDDFLTPAGDCILGIEADKAPADFDPAFVDACRDVDAEITAVIEAGDTEAEISGRGDPGLTFEDERSLVGRTSTYVDDRTVMLEADMAAGDLDRGLISTLGSGEPVTLRLRVE